MPTNFIPWLDSPQGGVNVQTPDTLKDDDQRQSGFKAGKPASALRVNTMLRQSSLVTVAFMEYLDTVNPLPADLSLLSTVDQMIAAMKASFGKNGDTTLAEAKAYTNTQINNTVAKIDALSSVVDANKQAAANANAATNTALGQTNTRVGTNETNIVNLQTTLTATQNRVTQLETENTALKARVAQLESYYEVDIKTSDWSGSAGSFNFTITAATHGRGKRPRVHTYVNGDETYDSPNVNMTTGDVTLYSNARIALKVVIY